MSQRDDFPEELRRYMRPAHRFIPQLLIRPEALTDLQLAIDLCPVEISGVGTVAIENGRRVITEIILFPQKCSWGGTEFDPEAFTQYQSDLVYAKRDAEINTTRVWWHSHVRSIAEFSSIDLRYIYEWGKHAGTDHNPWLISIVGNKHGDLTTRLDIFHPTRETIKDVILVPTEPFLSRECAEMALARLERMAALVAKSVTIERIVV